MKALINLVGNLRKTDERHDSFSITMLFNYIACQALRLFSEIRHFSLSSKRNFLFFCLVFLSTLTCANDLNEQRRVFQQAEKLLAKGNESDFWDKLEELEEYPLAPYLEYQWLKKHLDRNSEIEEFLQKHNLSLYAKPLRMRWLAYLAKEKQWQDYLHYYQSGLGVAHRCQYYWALYETGKIHKAMLGAKQLWVVGHSQPKQCDSLLRQFIESTYFQQDMVWRRFILAMNNGKTGLAGYVKKMLDSEKQRTADFWLQVHEHPERVIQVDQWDPKITDKGLIFVHGIKRFMNTDLAMAIKVWDANKNDLRIDKSDRQKLESKLALQLTFDKDISAYQRMNKLKHTNKTIREWRVRAALLSNDWDKVYSALNRLSQAEKSREKWRFWLARALYEKGEHGSSKQIFSALAKERSYYGFLAADHLQQEYQLSDRPINVDQDLLENLQARSDFQAVREFRFFNRKLEARRQWWYGIRNLDKKELLAAAKLAQQWQWHQIAIFTIAKAGYWDDVGLRFPLSYQQQVTKNASLRQLDPAIIFGLVRRESAFDQDAQSPVGASGLMQIMPQTGRQIAAKLNEKWHSRQILFNPVVNLKYGTYYYKQLLNRFEGNFVLAAAGYNAGPTRVDRWLPEEEAMPANIWIETISYKETRAYVSAILAYAIIYQQRIADDSSRISDFMPEVLTKAKMNIEGNTEKLHF